MGIDEKKVTQIHTQHHICCCEIQVKDNRPQLESHK